MTTPRRTRLIRVPNLHAFRSVIQSLTGTAALNADGADWNANRASHPQREEIADRALPDRDMAERVLLERAMAERALPDRLVIVPTRGAARQLLRSAVPAPDLRCVTRDELYEVLQADIAGSPKRLTSFARDSMMQAAASTAADPPFPIRPGLIGEMLIFYDQLRRQSQSVKRFQELLEDALAGHAPETDRGAERLLRQTRFLAGAFRDYERRVNESGGCDEHTVRERALEKEASVAVHHVLVTVPDWIADPNGLFVADFDLLARLPGLLTIDIVCTEGVLGSGFHERLHGWWPGLDEVEGIDLVRTARIAPTILTPETTAHAPADQPWFTYRDREEELIAVASRFSDGRRADGPGLDRVAVVFNRPLPYLYLAPDTLGAAGIPFESADALPLAAQPTSTVIDLILDAVETDFTRSSLVALLRTPHLQPVDDAGRRAAVAAFDRILSEGRYLGELSRLEGIRVEDSVRPAFDAALAAARELAPLADKAPASTQIRRLLAFLEARFRPFDEADPFSHNERRARAALLQTLAGMADAHAAHHDPAWSIEELAASVRRWIGDQTFVPDSTGSGIQLLDDQAARYADLDEITIVGLVENEWPERPRRNIFYPSSLLKALGWPSEKDRQGAAAARFLDLLASPSLTVVLSTFTLDDEALMTRSMLLDEVPRARLSSQPAGLTVPGPATADLPELAPGPIGFVVDEWVELRSRRLSSSDPSFHGSIGTQEPRAWSVSALETYLDCPFKFFAQHVLRLREEPDDEEVMDPRRQGQFVHEVFEVFFRDWQAAGHQAITATNLNDARRMFAEVVERALARLPNAEAGLERTRLLGSSAAAGLGEAVLRMEAERPVGVVRRLLEHRLEGTFTIATQSGARRIPLRGKADRLDVLADGTFRLIDYKLGWPPNKSRALQLPIYGLAAGQLLAPATFGEAAYLAFKGPKRVVPLFTSLPERDEVLAKAQQRLADTIDAIERGDFPPRPDDVYRCDTCSFASVCRKDYVGDV